MRAVAKEKSEQVVELGEQLDLVKKDQLAMAEHRSAKETYLEKEYLELLVENRQFKKRRRRSRGREQRIQLRDDDA
jgi:hypothetical protein